MLRLAGAGTGDYIDRRAEAHNARVAAAAGVNAEVLFFDVDDGRMLCRFVDVLTMTSGTFATSPGSSGRRSPSGACTSSRSRSRAASTCSPRSTSIWRCSGATGRASPTATTSCSRPRGGARQALALRPGRLAPCHNDPLAENFLDTGERMVIVDWEYAGSNDPMWDLGDLSVEAAFGPAQDAALLRAYFGGEPPAEAAGRMVLYQGLCDLVWTLWGLIQVMNDNPAEDFWAYALNRFERCQRLMASPGFARAIAAVRTG